MTSLTKPITRSTEILIDHRLRARDRDKIAVTLYPTREIGFRAYRCKREVRLDLAVVYRLALVEAARRERESKPGARGRGRLRKGGGR